MQTTLTWRAVLRLALRQRATVAAWITFHELSQGHALQLQNFKDAYSNVTTKEQKYASPERRVYLS